MNHFKAWELRRINSRLDLFGKRILKIKLDTWVIHDHLLYFYHLTLRPLRHVALKPEFLEIHSTKSTIGNMILISSSGYKWRWWETRWTWSRRTAGWPFSKYVVYFMIPKSLQVFYNTRSNPVTSVPNRYINVLYQLLVVDLRYLSCELSAVTYFCFFIRLSPACLSSMSIFLFILICLF